MPTRPLPEALVRAAVLPPAEGSDADLLGRFVTASDPAAFAEIVRRHGPMVLGVCRRALGNTPDADDAFQAVWLVLVRKARSVSPRNKVGNWLYGVAARTAAHARAKTATARRRTGRQELPDVPDPRRNDPDATEIAAVVDAELAQLPDKYRSAVVLCELESRSLKDAADQLGVPLGTIASRLARGRALLAERLKARGFAAATLGGVLVTATAPVSARLNELVLTLLATAPQDVARSVSELTHGVLAAMLAHQLKLIGRIAVAVALSTGAAVWAATAGAQPEAPPAPPAGPPVVNRDNPYAGLLDPKLPRRSREETAWDDLLLDDPHASRAVLDLAAAPKGAVAALKQKLRPLKADRADVKKWIADLASEKDDVWQPAFAKLSYHDPRLALDPEEAFAEAKTGPAKQRLAAILVAAPDPALFAPAGLGLLITLTSRNARTGTPTFTLSVPDAGTRRADGPTQTFTVPGRITDVRRPGWTRDVRAVVVLERIGTPEAQALLKSVAEGHPDALSTRTAKEALDRLNPKAP